MFNKNDSFYTIMLPNNSRKRLYFNRNSDFDDRIDKLEDLLTESWIDYCNSNWIDFNSGGLGNSSEDKVKRFLEGIANALLMRDSNKDINILKKDDFVDINSREVHLNSYFDDMNQPDSLEESIAAINKHLKQLTTGDGKVIQPEPIDDRVVDRRKKRTKLDKFNDIYGVDKGKSYDYIEDNRFPFMPKSWTEVVIEIPDKPGVINREKPYKSDWVNVRVDGGFTFNGIDFQISDEAEQYAEAGHTKIYETYRDDYGMVKILCYEQDNKYYFYDENIDSVNEFITMR